MKYTLSIPSNYVRCAMAWQGIAWHRSIMAQKKKTETGARSLIKLFISTHKGRSFFSGHLMDGRASLKHEKFAFRVECVKRIMSFGVGSDSGVPALCVYNFSSFLRLHEEMRKQKMDSKSIKIDDIT
jgi:hypothetical protein